MRLPIPWVLTHLAHVGWLLSQIGPIREMILCSAHFIQRYNSPWGQGEQYKFDHIYLYIQDWEFSDGWHHLMWLFFPQFSNELLSNPYIKSTSDWLLMNVKKCVCHNECSFPRFLEGFWISFVTILLEQFFYCPLPYLHKLRDSCLAMNRLSLVVSFFLFLALFYVFLWINNARVFWNGKYS